MVVDTPVPPTDDSYLDSLEEPWKSMVLKAIPPISADESSALADAAVRLEQFELDVRSQFLQLFFDTDPSETLEKAGAFWKAALNLCLHMVHGASKSKGDPRYADMTPRKLPVLLIEDYLDALPVEDAKKFWADYVEPSLDHPPQLLGELMWNSSNSSHLPFLRVCNQFLRVLDTASHSDQCEWKGRILTALAKGFSIADRSALKFWGSFHSSNVNDYESEETFEANCLPTKSKGSSATTKMDYSLYESFWSLQADFSNPNRIQVAAFIRKLKTVLEAMESAASSHAKSTAPLCTSIRYMTSSSLLPTQLSTVEFRSCVVSQFLITASHLSSESPALATALVPFLTRAKKLLQSDNPELYHLLWESILAHREDAWRKWKKEKCPVKAFAPKQTRKSLSETPTSLSKDKNQLLMAGSLGDVDAPAEHEYESLQSDELLKVSQDLKKAIPSLEEHLEPYVEALDPESGIEADYHPGSDPLFSWRAMRLYAKHQLPLLKNCRRPADLERITREWYRQQGKEIPGEMPPEQPDDDWEEDDNHSEKLDGKGSEMDEDETEKKDGDELSSNEGDRASGDEREEEAPSPIQEVETKDGDDEEKEERLSEKEKGDNYDEKSVDSVSLEEKEQAGNARDLTEPNTDDDNDEAANSSADYDQAKEDASRAKKNADEVMKDLEDEKEKPEATVEDNEFKEKSEDKKEETNSREIENSVVKEIEDPEASKNMSREASDDENSKKDEDRSRHRDSSSRKRRRSRSEERDGKRFSRGPSRERGGDQDRDRRDRSRPSGNRGGGQRNEGPQRGRGRNDDGGRRDEGPPARGGRGGGPPPPRRDDGPPSHGRGGGGGRHDDENHAMSGRFEAPPPPRRQDDGPPPGRGGGGRGGDRRDDRHRGGDRRSGRDDSRFRGRR